MKVLSAECALESLDCAKCAKDGCEHRCHKIAKLAKVGLLTKVRSEDQRRADEWKARAPKSTRSNELT